MICYMKNEIIQLVAFDNYNGLQHLRPNIFMKICFIILKII